MNIVGQFSDPLPFGFSVAEKSESSTMSDAGTPTTRTHTAAHSVSDEEVILASSRPKRRAGRRIFKETRHPIYRGVRRRNNNKWVCELREPNKKSRIWLGTYPTAEMAARAHDVAALALRGKSACLNFADSAWRLPTPASNNPSDIRTAAAQAAKECKDEEYITNQEEDEVVGRSVEEVESRAAEAGEAVYVDEEALSNMPLLLASMAEGLLISPPSFFISNYMEWDDMDMDMDMGTSDDVSLWSF